MAPLVPDEPEPFDVTIYIVLEDFDRAGGAYLETKEAKSPLIDDILSGQFDHIECIVAFNTSEGCSGDVTAQIAIELVDVASQRDIPIQGCARDLVDRYVDTTDA